MTIWTAISALGDVSIMLPEAVVVAFWLAMEGARRQALWWASLITMGAILVIITKVAFVGWGIGITALNFTGLSGHSTFATAVIPVIFYLALQRESRIIRAMGVLAGIAIGLLICVSRLVLHTHSMSEVIAGWFVGIVISVCFIRAVHASNMQIAHTRAMAFGVVFLFPFEPYIEAAPTQHWIVDVAHFLSGHERPCDRHSRVLSMK